MNSSESILKIAPALLAAQKKTGAALKQAVNPFFHSKYADLGSVMEACKEPFNTAGITILQPIVGVNVETILIHESGEWVGSVTPIICKDPGDPQKFGSAISYARRYGLQSMVLIPGEDDDGETAKLPGKQIQTPVVKPPVKADLPLNVTKCPECGTTGKYHKTGCTIASKAGEA